MKQYVVYDNVAGGYTIRYRFYLYKERRWVYRVYQAENYRAMKDFEKKLIMDNYKFVGSF